MARLPTRDHRRDDPRRPSLPHRDAVLALMASSLIAAACGSPTSSGPRSPAATSRAAIPHAATSAPGATATMGPATAHPGGALSLITEPEDGYHSIDQLISGARRIIDLTMYELADDQIQSLLVAARQRGVSIRVLFDHAHDGASVDQAAYSQLGCAGVPVRLAPDAVIFHQKTLSVDGTVSAVSSGSSTAGPAGSPGAEPALVALNNSAGRTLSVEDDEMGSSAVESTLETASRRGVDVEAWTSR